MALILVHPFFLGFEDETAYHTFTHGSYFHGLAKAVMDHRDILLLDDALSLIPSIATLRSFRSRLHIRAVQTKPAFSTPVNPLEERYQLDKIASQENVYAGGFYWLRNGVEQGCLCKAKARHENFGIKGTYDADAVFLYQEQKESEF